MNKLGIIFSVISFFIFISLQHNVAIGKNYYRTFEIIGMTGNILTLQDGDNNVIEVDKGPGNYKIGYKVRYDSVRKRLREYRWQNYEVRAISSKSITLQHKTGDTLSVRGNYVGKYDIGNKVRYNSVDNKFQADDDSGQWKQFTVIEAYSDKIILLSNDGLQIPLQMDNNLYPGRNDAYIYKYKVGDLVRYNFSNNKLKKGVIRTYDWQDYKVKKITTDQIVLINTNKIELILENTYRVQLKAGDLVKYDRLNNLLRKVR
jgi:hypothetical protein